MIQTAPTHVILVTGSRTWSDEDAMMKAFNDAWLRWGPETVARPLLISGACPSGADAMAERLWRGRNLAVQTMPAQWQIYGNSAGYIRNQQMVDRLIQLREQGSHVICVAFLDPCAKRGCPRGAPGHYSHGTEHCAKQARAAGISVVTLTRASG